MKSKKKLNWKICLAALLTEAVVFILTYANPNEAYWSGFHKAVTESFISRSFETLNFAVTDSYYQQEYYTELPIHVIGIDEKTLNELGRYEYWSRDMYATLLDRLHDLGDPDDPSDDIRPAVVSFDMLFTGNINPETDKLFADTCAKYGDTVQGLYYDLYQGEAAKDQTIKYVAAPYPELYAASKVGCTNNGISSDGKARTIFIDVYSDEPVDSLALATYKSYLEYIGEPYVPHKYLSGEYGPVYFTYTAANKENSYPFDYYSFSDVYYGRKDVNLFADGIVFVGAYAAGFQDDFFTPVNKDRKMYGVDIHANSCEAIADGKLQVAAGRTLTAIIYAILSAAVVLFVYLTSLPVAIIGCVGVVGIDLLVNYLVHIRGVDILFVYLALPVLLIMAAAIIMHYLNARKEKAKINDAFKMYVAPEVVDEMYKDGNYEMKLGGQTKDIAVLFIDIRGFTTMSEGLHPEEVVSILNEYFGLVTDAIFKNKGTLDKFIGDAAMAVFNSPNDLDDYVYRAVHTAWDIALGSQALAQRLLETHGRTINYGIGVNCGPATIGNIGSEFRRDFTAIGDTVNTSARLEANAKAGQILISQADYDIVKDWVETEDIGTIPLKGKSNEIFVYNVIKVIDKPGYLENRAEAVKKKKTKNAVQ